MPLTPPPEQQPATADPVAEESAELAADIARIQRLSGDELTRERARAKAAQASGQLDSNDQIYLTALEERLDQLDIRPEAPESRAVLGLMAAIRDALDVPAPAVGTPEYARERLLGNRSGLVISVANVMIRRGAVDPGLSWWTDWLRRQTASYPVTYPTMATSGQGPTEPAEPEPVTGERPPEEPSCGDGRALTLT